jgi:hypothetical protein
VLAIEQRRQGLTLQQLHDDERIAERGLPYVEHAHDGRMLKLRRRSRFLKQPSTQKLAAQIGSQQLDRDQHVERRIARSKHRPHAALTEQLLEQVLRGDQIAGSVGEASVVFSLGSGRHGWAPTLTFITFSRTTHTGLHGRLGYRRGFSSFRTSGRLAGRCWRSRRSGSRFRRPA